MNRGVEPASHSRSAREQALDSAPDSSVRVVIRRRRQQVVVRAGSASDISCVPPESRTPSDTPTLIGLDVRERQETLPDLESGSHVVVSVVLEDDFSDDAATLLAIRRRPVVLREGVDDMLVEQYRAEARRILASGIFASDRR